mmetsp:Transcript_14719/g.22387  ORF Transcript_14719/g.22387 Transcript_14719/m.22387 type:complete len:562 (-) Transcript_14719:3076-4761(-)
MHVDAVLRRRAHLLLVHVLRDLRVVGHVVQRPLVGLVLARHLLLHGREHALRVEEAREPVRVGPAALQPPAVLLVAGQQRGEPDAQPGQDPGELVAGHGVDPEVGHAGVEHGVQRPLQFLGHHHLAVDRQPQLRQDEAHLADDPLQPLDLLEEEDVQRHRQAAQLVDLDLVVVLVVVLRQPLLQLLALLADHVLAAHAAVAAATLGLRLTQRVEQRVHLLLAEGQVRVRVQPEDLRGVDLREGRQVRAVVRVLLGLRDPVHKVVGDAVDGRGRVVVEGLGAGVGREPHLGVRLEHAPVQVVCDFPAVLGLGHHVLEGGPGDGAVVQVLLQEEDAGGQVARVVLVGDAPAEGAELAALLHHGVQEAQAEDQLAPLGGLHALQPLLVHDDRVGAQQAGLEPRGRLVGHLGRHLQQAQRELVVGQRRDEQAEARVHGLHQLGHQVLHHVHQPQAELAVLQQHPGAVGGGRVHGLDGHGLLALSQRDGSGRRELPLPGQLFDGLGGVRTHGQEEDHGHLRHHLGVDFVDGVGDRLDVGGAHLLAGADELLTLQDAPVHAQRAHQQ